MSQTIIPAQFERYLVDKITAGSTTDMNEFVFAHIPNLDAESPIDRALGLPSEAYIVHRQKVDQAARLNSNTLVYSVILQSTTPSFKFNAIYLHDKHVENSCGLIVYKNTETKEENMTTIKSVAQEYSGAAAIANIHVDPGTWQIDFHGRLMGIDDDLRLANLDHYGHSAFVRGCSVVAKGKSNTFVVSPGVVYVSGLRVELSKKEVVASDGIPCGLYLDVVRQGSALSRWENIATVRSSKTELSNYVDENGQQHYIARLAGIDSHGNVTDWRVWDVITQQQAEAGEDEYRSLWSAKRVFQSVASYINKNVKNATKTASGWMSASDKKKLDGIQSGAQVNVATDLSVSRNANSQTVNSSTGKDATLSAATTSSAGMMTAEDKKKLGGIQAGSQANIATNLTASRNATTQTIKSSTGKDAVLSAVTTSHAGVMTAADKKKLDGVATQATKNQTDAHLKNRANHTGTQAISTVSGLQNALNKKVNIGDSIPPKVYTGTNPNHLDYPIGTVLKAFSTIHTKVNSRAVLAINTDAQWGGNIFWCDQNPRGGKGRVLAGTWAKRGGVVSLSASATADYERIL